MRSCRWFANQSVDAAANWTTNFFETTDVQAANALPNNPAMYIAETGWPTVSLPFPSYLRAKLIFTHYIQGSKDPASGSDGPSIASVPNLQIFINDFVCSSNEAGINYFFFEVFDEPWKDAEFGGVEGYWGVFNFKCVHDPTFPLHSMSGF
jgi:exo-beta-1,3-glucanase (GH17 family)